MARRAAARCEPVPVRNFTYKVLWTYGTVATIYCTGGRFLCCVAITATRTAQRTHALLQAPIYMPALDLPCHPILPFLLLFRFAAQ